MTSAVQLFTKQQDHFLCAKKIIITIDSTIFLPELPYFAILESTSEHNQRKIKFEPLMSQSILPMSLLCFWVWEHCSCVADNGGSALRFN